MPQRTDEEWLRFEHEVNDWPVPKELSTMGSLPPYSAIYARAVRAELIAEFQEWIVSDGALAQHDCCAACTRETINKAFKP
jgi:hypothetical protein